MKIQIDTQNKIIKVEGSAKVAELMKHLEQMLPKGSPFGCYDEYSIDFNTTIQWYNYPVIVNPVYTPQKFWWDVPQPTCFPSSGDGFKGTYVGSPLLDQMPVNECDFSTSICAGSDTSNGVSRLRTTTGTGKDTGAQEIVWSSAGKAGIFNVVLN